MYYMLEVFIKTKNCKDANELLENLIVGRNFDTYYLTYYVNQGEVFVNSEITDVMNDFLNKRIKLDSDVKGALKNINKKCLNENIIVDFIVHSMDKYIMDPMEFMKLSELDKTLSKKDYKTKLKLKDLM